MTALPVPTGRDPTLRTRRVLRGVVAVQLIFAVFLFGNDMARALPRLFWPSDAPGLADPFSPGDQTRRYRPADVPTRAPAPGSRPVPASTDMPDRLAMAMDRFDDLPVLTLTGTIAPGDADRLTDFLAIADAPTEVFINSPGGSVQDALAIGRTLRALDVTTRMSATDICLSACPYLLAAGTTRIVADGAWVGVHQHYFGENTLMPAFLAVADIQRGQGEVMRFLIEMGIDPAVMEPALLTPPDEIYLLTTEELTRYRLIFQPEETDAG